MTDFSLNLIELGHFAAMLALAVALVQALAPAVARVAGQPALAWLSVRAAMLVFGLTSIGGLVLMHAFVSGNFSVLYVAQHSNTLLPLFYKVTALWGGHEGSLYLWAWILTLYTLVVAWHGRWRYPEHLPLIIAVQGWLVVGFFGLILFLSNPFERLIPVPPDGNDLNPLLQDPGMAFHPPLLYLGYVGFSVPFAFALTALITRWRSELWTGLIRRWALIAWGFLTTGILLGGGWAYYELGWGGYWAWDPVENASFMPWLLGTALIHSIAVQDRRQMLHAWNIFLVISTFSLSLLGTFLVRSGVLSSVHAFAVDPGRGAYILAFMIIVLTVSFGIFLARGRYQEAEETITSFLSRESLFVWNNVLFTVACAVVMLGTLYPLALDALTGAKITVGAPYFNTVMVPIFLAILLLMGIGYLVPWRKANTARLGQRLRLPAVLGVGGALASLFAFGRMHWTGPLAIGFVLFAATTHSMDYLRAVRVRRAQLQEPVGRALLKTVAGNRRHYGGMAVHFGILVIAIGLVGSGLFREERAVTMAPGDVLDIGAEKLRFEGVTRFQKDNYDAIQGRFTLLNSGNRAVTPERRRYPRQEAPMTETGIDSTPLRDVYLVLADPAPGGRWGVHAYINPLVQFIWIGGLVVIAGLLLTLSGRRLRARRRIRKRRGGGEVTPMRRLVFILLLVSGAALTAPVTATGSRGEALSETGAKSPESGMSRRLTMSDSASPLAASTVTEDPIERQMLDIAKDLRCAVCQNQPVSESNADLARDMRAIILDQLKQGKSREQIIQYFVERYGDYVLMNPPVRGPGLLLWALPAGVFGALGITAFVYLRHRRRATLPPTPALTAADRKRIEKARKDESDA